jgi:predicted DNA-binding protein with PD1-like motif
MKAAEGKIGRVFVFRLEDGDVVPRCIEEFAAQNNISVGHAVIIGAVINIHKHKVHHLLIEQWITIMV